jgi:hypothetical protein
MNKKVYIQPQATFSGMEMTEMIAASNLFTGENVELNGNTMQEGDGSDAASRHNSVWDDDLDEEW